MRYLTLGEVLALHRAGNVTREQLTGWIEQHVRRSGQ